MYRMRGGEQQRVQVSGLLKAELKEIKFMSKGGGNDSKKLLEIVFK